MDDRVHSAHQAHAQTMTKAPSAPRSHEALPRLGGRTDSFSSTSSVGSARDLHQHAAKRSSYYGNDEGRASARLSGTSDANRSSSGSNRGSGVHRGSLRSSLSGHNRRKPMVIQFKCSPSTASSLRDSSRLDVIDTNKNAMDSTNGTTTLSSTASARRGSLSLAMVMNAPDYKAKKYDIEWQKDHDVSRCQVCAAGFKLSRRKHHCRMCGEIICADCSPDQVVFQGKYTGAKRTCVVCFALLEVMMQCGDDRVTMGRRPQPAVFRQLLNDNIAARHVQHDRCAELERVLGAVRQAKRHEQRAMREMHVISTDWLRSWLAFVRLEQLSDDDLMLLTTTLGVTLAPQELMHAYRDAPPSFIGNLELLDVYKGCLVRREDVEFQHEFVIIPKEVWDVLVRWYGGGPIIRVLVEKQQLQKTSVMDIDWAIDMPSLLSFALLGSTILPHVEAILWKRHEKESLVAWRSASASHRACELEQQAEVDRAMLRLSMVSSSSDNHSSEARKAEKAAADRRASTTGQLSASRSSIRGSTQIPPRTLELFLSLPVPPRKSSPTTSQGSRPSTTRDREDHQMMPRMSLHRSRSGTLSVPSEERPPVTRRRRRSVSSSKVDEVQKAQQKQQQQQQQQRQLQRPPALSMPKAEDRRDHDDYDNQEQDSPSPTQHAAQAASAFALAMKQARLNAQRALHSRIEPATTAVHPVENPPAPTQVA